MSGCPSGSPRRSRTPRGRSIQVVGRLKPGVTVRSRAGGHDPRRSRSDPEVSRLQHRLDRPGRAAPRSAHRRRAPGAPGARRRGRLRAPHRLRERREPAPGPGDGATAGACRPGGARRRTRAPHPAVARRKPGALGGGRRRRSAAGVVGAPFPPGRRRRATAHPASRAGRHRRLGPGLHARRVSAVRPRLRRRSRAHGCRIRLERLAQGRRPHGIRVARESHAERVRHRRNRARARAPGRRRPPDAELQASAATSIPGFDPVAHRDDAAVASGARGTEKKGSVRSSSPGSFSRSTRCPGVDVRPVRSAGSRWRVSERRRRSRSSASRSRRRVRSRWRTCA